MAWTNFIECELMIDTDNKNLLFSKKKIYLFRGIGIFEHLSYVFCSLWLTEISISVGLYFSLLNPLNGSVHFSIITMTHIMNLALSKKKKKKNWQFTDKKLRIVFKF